MPEEALRIGMVGDLALGGALAEQSVRQGDGYPFDRARGLLGRADLLVGNLEGFVAPAGENREGRPRLAIPARLAGRLAAAGFDVLSLANNHIMDGGPTGLRATLESLDASGIVHFGAGNDRRTAEEPVVIERKGWRVGLVGACDDVHGQATRSRPGVAPLRSRRLVKRVRALRGAVDLVVVSLHADMEFTAHPAPWRQRLSRRLVASGADLVYQHHPHVCQGIEHYREGLIAYSLGNFTFPVVGNAFQERYRGTRQGMLWEVRALPAGRRPVLVQRAWPVAIDEIHRPVPESDRLAAAFRDHLEELSAGLGDRRRLRLAYLGRCRKEARNSLYSLLRLVREQGPGRLGSALGALLGDPKERKWILGLLTRGRA